MRSRGLVVAIAVVLAVAAAAAVILYTQGVKEDAERGGELTTVIVSSQTIPPSQQLDSLIDQGIFGEVDVPRDSLVAGAVTDIRELEGQTTVSEILANEQIPLSRLSSGEGNPVGVSEGHIGVAVELEAPQGGTGNINPGDNVAVFATFQNIQAIAGTPAQLRQALNNPTVTSPTGRKVDLPDFTVTLIQTVRVLRIENPSVDTETGEQNDSDNIRITLDLLPQDAQNLVFAQENGLVWLGLLNPANGDDGLPTRASTVPIELLLGARLR
ncbi:MAG TPA: RcpC/CpaB family pilus assembly protein [Actinomycetota bacterium]|nr:RcpC/CpaB family pilus assembly protein [Actinomycetota bacterium]